MARGGKREPARFAAGAYLFRLAEKVVIFGDTAQDAPVQVDAHFRSSQLSAVSP
jgi:hypothetical protein